MTIDPIKDFAYSAVVTAPSPQISGLSLGVTSGTGTLFAAGFATVWPNGVQPTKANAEIIKITAGPPGSDTFTILRAQGLSSAINIGAGYQIQQGVTAELLAEIEGATTTEVSRATAAEALRMTTATYDPAGIAQQLVGLTATQTLTNKRLIVAALLISSNSATPTINTDTASVVHITAQAANITSMTTNLSGTPNESDALRISITPTAAITVAWGSKFEASTGTPLVTSFASGVRYDMGFFWNTETSKWRAVGSS